MKYHSRGLNSRGLALFLDFWKRKQDVLVQKWTADTLSISPMSVHSLWEREALKISLSYKNVSVEGNWTSVSVAQGTRQKLKLFQLLLLFRLKDQAWTFLANKEKQEHCMFIWPCKWAVDHSSLLQFNTACRTTKATHILILSVTALTRKIKWRYWKMRTSEPGPTNQSKISEELDWLCKPKKLITKRNPNAS